MSSLERKRMTWFMDLFINIGIAPILIIIYGVRDLYQGMKLHFDSFPHEKEFKSKDDYIMQSQKEE